MTEKASYLGDGAYCEWRDIGDLLVYTSDGIRRTNEVVLGPHELSQLVRFAAASPAFLDAITRVIGLAGRP